MDINNLIIPAAGLGTRFLPLTKSIPKEMVPLGDKPAIHYIIQEALSADIHNFVFIVSKDKQAISHYFSPQPTLAATLKQRNQQTLTAAVDTLIEASNFHYIEQPEPLGLGHAILLARDTLAHDAYFAVALPDDIIVGPQPGLQQLMRIAQQEQASVIAVQEITGPAISAYGVVAVDKQVAPGLFQMRGLVEKPAPQDAPSNLAIVGRYIFSPTLFPALESIKRENNKEIQLTDGIAIMLERGEKVFAYVVQGERYDVGTPQGWLKAVNSPFFHTAK